MDASIKMGQSIQFHNLESTVNAFTNRGVDAFSISQAKQFMFKGVGLDELQNILNALKSGATNAVYTLKVYEGIEDDVNIKSNTPDDGSFNFRLNAPEMALTQSQFTSYKGNAELLERLEAIEEKLETPEAVNSLGKIGDVLAHPVLAPLVPMLVEKIMSFIMSNPQPGNKQIAISGLSDNSEIQNGNILLIVDELKKYDPDLEKHLYKLLDLAKSKPDTFKQIMIIFNQ